MSVRHVEYNELVCDEVGCTARYRFPVEFGPVQARIVAMHDGWSYFTDLGDRCDTDTEAAMRMVSR